MILPLAYCFDMLYCCLIHFPHWHGWIYLGFWTIMAVYPPLIRKPRQNNLIKCFRNNIILGLHNTWSWKGTITICFLSFLHQFFEPWSTSCMFIFAWQESSQFFMICSWKSLTNLIQDPWVRRCWEATYENSKGIVTLICLLSLPWE